MSVRKMGNIKVGEAMFFLCDMQERFRPAIKYFTEIVEVAKRLVQGAKILDVPLIVTEQYPKGLGKTVEELEIDHCHGPYPKTRFSMLIPEVEKKMTELGQKKHVVIFGIETHVCVQQSIIELVERGYEVHVVADATSSRSQTDRVMALHRFRAAGVTVTTSEAILLQLVGDKDHAKFKEIQGLIKASAPDTGLLSSL